MKKLFCVCGALLAALVFLHIFLHGAAASAAGSAASSGSAGPAGCLAEIQAAIDNADYAAFDRLVDSDAILDSALDVFLAEMNSPGLAENLPPIVAMLFSQAAGRGRDAETLRGILRSEAGAFLQNGIASGAFAGRKNGEKQARGMLAPLFADVSLGRKEIRSVGQAVADGEGYVVPFVVRDFGNGLDYPVTGRLSPTENGFRLTGIENLRQLMLRIAAEGSAAPAE